MQSKQGSPSINFNRLSVKYKQTGATLIVVLVILILVTSIGIVAIKNSNTSLRISTAEQLNDLKFRANDATLIKVEKEDRANPSDLSPDRLKGYMMENVEEGEEVVFCLTPKNKDVFSITRITVKRADGSVYTGKNNGFCDPESKESHYMNEGRTLTQITFVKLPPEEIFDKEAGGTSSNNMKVNGIRTPQCTTIKGYITTVIPAVSSASPSDIAKCLKKGYANDDSVDRCLDQENVTHETQIQVYKNIPRGYKCV